MASRYSTEHDNLIGFKHNVKLAEAGSQNIFLQQYVTLKFLICLFWWERWHIGFFVYMGILQGLLCHLCYLDNVKYDSGFCKEDSQGLLVSVLTGRRVFMLKSLSAFLVYAFLSTSILAWFNKSHCLYILPLPTQAATRLTVLLLWRKDCALPLGGSSH